MGMLDLPWLKKVRLIKGFVFKSVFGERPDLCRQLLEVVLGIEIAEVEVVQRERELDVLDKRRGGSIDLYVVDGCGNRYDVEVQTRFHKDEWFRARLYQELMDANLLKRGTDVTELRESMVVFICDFDPLGHEFARYDCATVCLQTGEVVPDRRGSVYLNVHGDLEELTPELRNLLLLFAGKAVDNDDFVGKIVDEMKKCVEDPEWMERFMTLEDEMEAEKKWARAEGLEEGRKQGLAEGRKLMAEQNARLVDALERAGRLSELADAMRDRDRYDALLEEFGITGNRSAGKTS